MKFILEDMQVLVEIITKTQIQRKLSTLKHNVYLPNEKEIIIYRQFSIISHPFDYQRTPLKFGSTVSPSDLFFWLQALTYYFLHTAYKSAMKPFNIFPCKDVAVSSQVGLVLMAHSQCLLHFERPTRELCLIYICYRLVLHHHIK